MYIFLQTKEEGRGGSEGVEKGDFEAKSKISNSHSSKTMIDIKTISFLQSSLVKYETFDQNEH